VVGALLATRERPCCATTSPRHGRPRRAPAHRRRDVVSEPGPPRTAGQRRADALVDLISLGADRGVEGRRVGGPSSELHLSTTPEALIEAASARVRRADQVVPGLGLRPSTTPRSTCRPGATTPRSTGHPARVQHALDRAVDRVVNPARDAHLDDHDHPST